jgi:DNA polymerase
METTTQPIIEKPLQSWDELRESIAACQLCSLHKSRTQTVFGVGNPNADLLFIGEAPGASEDEQGEPFVGRAGRLLNSMLESIGLSREDIFIANILKCRPPKNRDPEPEEVATCTPYLLQQIDSIKPKLIVALGRIAAQFLLETTTPLSKLRNNIHDYHGCKLITIYHPAYLLRSPSKKAIAWEDMVKIRSFLQLNESIQVGMEQIEKGLCTEGEASKNKMKQVLQKNFKED